MRPKSKTGKPICIGCSVLALERRGDLVGAFDAYRKFGELPLFQQKGIPSKDDPLHLIPAQVWFRGRMAAMFSKREEQECGEPNKTSLEEKIWKDWLQVAKDNDLNKIRGFVSMFDATFKVGQEGPLATWPIISSTGAISKHSSKPR